MTNSLVNFDIHIVFQTNESPFFLTEFTHEIIIMKIIAMKMVGEGKANSSFMESRRQDGKIVKFIPSSRCGAAVLIRRNCS